MTAPTVLTIGHSTHPLDRFVALLQAHCVTAIADVRSMPYSRFQPDFDREALAKTLGEHGIAYVFLGAELGGRSQDPTCYEEGRVQYRTVARTELFRSGLERLVEGAQIHRVALLCAEKEPLDCHRTLLVARELDARGVAVAHIHADGQLETHAAAMTRLLERYGMADRDLFRSREEQVVEACTRQEQKIAYVLPEGRVPGERASP